ncbi:MAG: YkvA family protein [Terrimicrobiaceae bacterium]|nr:YkvA family protein [Terrimicrobiaceae bacterium]
MASLLRMKPKPLTHRTHVIIARDNPGQPTSVDDFLSAEGALMTSREIAHLRSLSHRIHEKLLTEQARGHADLHDGARTLLRAIESPDAENDPLPPHIAEAAAALAYLLKGADIIPDWVPEIGLTDDARIVARVLERHPSLRR